MFIESCTKYGSIEAIEKCQIQKLMIAQMLPNYSFYEIIYHTNS